MERAERDAGRGIWAEAKEGDGARGWGSERGFESNLELEGGIWIEAQSEFKDLVRFGLEKTVLMSLRVPLGPVHKLRRRSGVCRSLQKSSEGGGDSARSSLVFKEDGRTKSSFPGLRSLWTSPCHITKNETMLVSNYSRIFQLFSVSPPLRHYIEKKNQQLKNFVWFQGVLCLLPIISTKMEKSKKSFMKLLKNFSQYRRAVFTKRKKQLLEWVCGNWILVEFV